MHSTTPLQPHHSIPLFILYKPSPISHGYLDLDLARSSLIPLGPPHPKATPTPPLQAPSPPHQVPPPNMSLGFEMEVEK